MAEVKKAPAQVVKTAKAAKTAVAKDTHGASQQVADRLKKGVEDGRQTVGRLLGEIPGKAKDSTNAAAEVVHSAASRLQKFGLADAVGNRFRAMKEKVESVL
jgi:hypothetical protein